MLYYSFVWSHRYTNFTFLILSDYVFVLRTVIQHYKFNRYFCEISSLKLSIVNFEVLHKIHNVLSVYVMRRTGEKEYLKH